MKIYLDLVLILNFIFDLLLLITVSYVLKRNVSNFKLILGAFIGSLSILFLFISLNSFELFILKFLISIGMCITSFSYRNIRYTLKNISYLYIVSIILGGFLYFLNIEFSYKNNGIVFFHDGLSVNVIFLIIISPIILILYKKQAKELKTNYSNYYKVNIFLKNNIIKTNAFLDTGNKLSDPYFNKPVLILDKKKMIYDINEFKMILIPYKTITESSILTCIQVNKIEIKGIGVRKNVLIGLSNQDIRIDGVDLILNSKILEET